MKMLKVSLTNDTKQQPARSDSPLPRVCISSQPSNHIPPHHSLQPIKSTQLNCRVHSASLHPSKERFVAGGLDFYLHVFDYNSGNEIGMREGVIET